MSGSSDEDFAGGDNGAGGGNNRLSVERIYQKKTQLEHILLRPDTYIGSVESITQPMWVYDGPEAGLVIRNVTFVPGLYKIFDEILVNAADNKQKSKSMDTLKVDIDAENNTVSIWNNGDGIPVVEHKDEKMFVPSLIFGHLLTSSNYNDDEKKVTGGRNGYGAKLCNIFSTKFTVETSCKSSGKMFKQTWKNNMVVAGEPIIKSTKGSDYTKITFSPDLAKFKMTSLDKDIVALMSRRALDVAGSSRGVKVFLNGTRVPIKSFKDYVEMYVKDKEDESGNPLKVVYETVNDRWEVAATVSAHGYQQVSFVNSIATTKGGKHADYVTDQIVNKVIEVAKKKAAKSTVVIRAAQVKTHIWVFINCLIENPTFDSQTKENMTLQLKNFGSKCILSDKFITAVLKTGIVEAVRQWVDYKAKINLDKKCSGSKLSKLKGIPKLEDANDAGTKHGVNCTLILTEGDSAKTVAVAGLGVIGRDRYGVFPLKGKILNVRDAPQKQICENAEINNIIKIIGLQYKKQYNNEKDLSSLRYGRMMIMTDQDQDGSHIKGLLINFIHSNWPGLLKIGFLEEFITPIVKVKKGKNVKSFYSLPEFEEWRKDDPDSLRWKVKYYKGLGTSSSAEAKEYFSDMKRHRILFKHGGQEDDSSINLAFSRKFADNRKEWLDQFLQERKQRREMGLPDHYLYGKNTTSITYYDFVNKELILYSNSDNERSIPSMMDGFKPGSRKVLFSCFKRNLIREVKVAQLAGSVGELSAYHHGEASLQGTIINLAQNFVGSNNINLLLPIGQFGTRLLGGKDQASARYIFTKLSSLAFHIFNKLDEPLLNHLTDDNQKIQPEFYVPIIPMSLVNGAEGIGTGWMTKVPNYNPRDVVANIKRLLKDEPLVPMLPWYKHFVGTIEPCGENHFAVSGEISVMDDGTSVSITELPVGVWTQTFKESVMELLLHGSEKSNEKAAKNEKAGKGDNATEKVKKKPGVLTDYKEYHTDTKVHFLATMPEEVLRQAESIGLHKFFKLQTTISTNNLTMFDSGGCIHRYANAEEVLNEFYGVRLEFYIKRKKYLEGMLEAEARKLDNQARFILEKISGEIVLENKKRQAILSELVSKKFDPDPVKQWKQSQMAHEGEVEEEEENDNNEDSDSQTEAEGEKKVKAVVEEKSDYDYLMNLHLWHLSMEKKNALLAQRDSKREELLSLKKKTPKELWSDDLNNFLVELDRVELNEKLEAEKADKKGKKVAPAGKAGIGRGKAAVKQYAPTNLGIRVEPKVDLDTLKRVNTAAKAKDKPRQKSVNTSKSDSQTQDDSDTDIKPLAERLNVKSNVTTKPARKTGLKQTTISFPKKAAGKKGSPVKKKNNLSDDDDDDNMSSESDMFGDSDESDATPPKAKVPTEADQSFLFDSLLSDATPETATRPQSNHTNNNNNNGMVLVSSSDSDSPPPVSKALAKPKKVAPVKKRAAIMDDSDSDSPEKAAKRKKPSAAAKPKQKAKYQMSEDSDDSFDEVLKRSKAADLDVGGESNVKFRSARSKPTIKYTFDDSEGDD